MGSIVQVNVNVVTSPMPETLQQTGAIVSQGGTTLTPGTYKPLATPSDLSSYLAGAKAVTSITQTSGTATATATQPHGFTVGDSLQLVISGAAVAAYNGTFTVTVTSSTAFTFSIPSGTTTPAGGTIVYTVEDVGELVAQNTTYFAQGNGVGTYVLEIGPGNASDGVTALTNYLNAFPNTDYTPGSQGYFYAYLVPRSWGSASSFITLCANYAAPTKLTYFFTTVTLASYASWLTSPSKSAFAEIETPQTQAAGANALTAISYSAGVVTATTTTPHGLVPGDWFQLVGNAPVGYNGWWQAQAGTTGSTLVYNVPSALAAETALGTLVAQYNTNAGVPPTEFSVAASFYDFLVNAPSPANQLLPMAFRFQFGVTPWPPGGNSALFATLRTAQVNIVGTGAEGGISKSLINYGTMLDGNDASIWYAVDWVQINLDIDTANEVFNGSNSQPPLIYNQDGINRLQNRAARTMKTGISSGMVTGQLLLTQLDAPTFQANVEAGVYEGITVVNAEPFASYNAENPNDYAQGKYAGLSVGYTPARGFKQIVYTVDVFNIAAA